MESKINELTEKLLKEGIEKGQEEASKIIDNAKAEAQRIIDEAKSQAESIKMEARKDADTLDKNTRPKWPMSCLTRWSARP